jgi:DNA mismatch endonuclease (patch repair protein)
MPLPKSNADFWRDKFEKNVERDRIKKEMLESDGWTVIVIWECEMEKDIDDAVRRIASAVSLSAH